MPCTTLLVGKDAAYDGSTMIARNDDSGGGHYTPKKMVVVNPKDQPRVYESVISHVRIELPDNPLRYTAVPNAVDGEGIWAAGGINEANVGMTACETISSNERVLAADPILLGQHNNVPPAASLPEAEAVSDGNPLYGEKHPEEPTPGGIGEEDMVVLVLPYIRSAREGVKRLGALLKEYGTYEMNGIAFNDAEEIWYLESVGGHHWIARKVPDRTCALIPNQFSIDFLDLDDALGEQRENMCSPDLLEFIEDNHLDLEMPMRGHHAPHGPGPHPGPDPFGGPRGPKPHGGPGDPPPFPPHPMHGMNGNGMGTRPEDGMGRPVSCGRGRDGAESMEEFPQPMPDNFPDRDFPHPEDFPPHRILNTRLAFGSCSDADHVYNTPRAWDMGRCLAPYAFRWNGPDADFTPESDNIPWCIVPEHKVTVEDVKYLLSLHFQGTPFDPYEISGDGSRRGKYRAIGINRTDVLAILQIRSDRPAEYAAVEWVSFASNVFNVSVPFYSNVTSMPTYLSGGGDRVSTENFYWSARLVAALSDACVQKNLNHIEIYQITVQTKGHMLISQYDRLQAAAETGEERMALRQKANEEIAAMLKEETDHTLGNVLYEASNTMKNQYLRSDH